MKAATIKVLGQIVLALLGLAGTALGVWSQIRTADTDAVLKVSVDTMGQEVLPAIQGRLTGLEKENRVLIDSLGLLRERMAKVEGCLEERDRNNRRRPRRSPAAVFPLAGDSNAGGREPHEDIDRQLDTLIMKGASEPLEIPQMDYRQMQVQAQEEK